MITSAGRSRIKRAIIGSRWHSPSNPNYVPARRLASATATVAGDRPQWVRFVLAGQPIKLPEGLPMIVVLRSVPIGCRPS
ncbi:hypothetical protein ACIBQX_39500 [Nonomuraea sp. NPDC049714]|uniref:hypothetical protein n=1 Tax=Nonomuraea sp. NPDC049714 TaxID=3364357 RepID=UPI00379B35EC